MLEISVIKKLLVAALALVVLAAAGVFFWARTILASDPVRRAVESQLTQALGQPVRIGRLDATILPRVTMSLRDVRIGDPARITARALDVGTNLRALVSRRIEHGTVRLDGARVELPLAPFAFQAPAVPTGGNGSANGAGTSANPAIQIVSIDRITLDNVAIVSGGRTISGDVDLSVSGGQLVIDRGDFLLGQAPMSLVGRIDDVDGPAGDLSVTGETLDILGLLAFVTDFAGGGLTTTTTPPPATSAAAPMRLTVSLDAARATLGTLLLDRLNGRAVIGNDAVSIEPMTFGVLGGRTEASLSLTLADLTEYRLTAALDSVDLASLAAFVGHTGLFTGRLAGRLAVVGRGTTPESVIQSTTGTARIDATNGTIRGLGLVRTVVLAGSMRASSQAEARGSSAPEPFTRFGATLALANAVASTTDLRFESDDLRFDGFGGFRLDGQSVDISGKTRLSEALTAKAGRDLVRYTVEDGRVTLPVTINGPASDLRVRLDTRQALERAITNRAAEELKKALGGLLGQ